MKILIIDDEKIICESLKNYLSLKGYDDADISFDALTGEELLLSGGYDLVFLDITMPCKSGYQILIDAKKNGINSLIVMLTAISDISTVVNCIKAGAFDYMTKPLNNELILSVIIKAGENLRIRKSLNLFTSECDLEIPNEFSGFFTSDGNMKKIMAYSAGIASRDCNVLITGESGTGKEIFAKAIHKLSRRKNNPFIAININAVPVNLFESSLFGYKKGAFTNALKDNAGYIKNAESGVLFLDEIGDLDLQCQTKLLRVIEEKIIYPVGSDKPEQADFRLITATNRNLKEDVKSGKFRADLYYRIADGIINLPPIRDRGKDVIFLARNLLEKLNKSNGFNKSFSDSFLNILLEIELRGNYRELQHIIKTAFFSSSKKIICENDFNFDIDIENNIGTVKPSKNNDFADNTADKMQTLEEVKIDYIKRILKLSNNNKKAANILGISEQQIYNIIKKYKL